MRTLGVCVLMVVMGWAVTIKGAEPKELVKEVVKAAGGEGKLLKLFRMKERLNVSSNPDAKGNERMSVIEPPKHWWLGKNQRQNEPATWLVWVWTLGALTDPNSKLEAIPDITEGERQAVGLRISGTIDPPLEVYFDQENKRLVRIDWRSDIHRFSEWKEANGTGYPSRTIGYKKTSGKPWYFTEILELEPLTELPVGLQR